MLISAGVELKNGTTSGLLTLGEWIVLKKYVVSQRDSDFQKTFPRRFNSLTIASNNKPVIGRGEVL